MSNVIGNFKAFIPAASVALMCVAVRTTIFTSWAIMRKLCEQSEVTTRFAIVLFTLIDMSF